MIEAGWKLDQRFETSAGTVAAGTTGSGPDLVLAHGWPWSSFAWHRVIPLLAKQYCVHWYDMPGYGQSSKDPQQATSLDVQGQVFAEMLDHWQLQSPLVIAHDFGGAVSLRAHLLHGCDYRAWVLMNVVAVRPWGSEFFDHVGKHIKAFEGLPPHIHAALVRAYIEGALIRDIHDSDLQGLIDPWLNEAGASSFYRQFAQADERFTQEVEDRFGKLRCPVTILWGTGDPWIPLERGLKLASMVNPQAFIELPGLGHLPQLEDSAATGAELCAALEAMLAD